MAAPPPPNFGDMTMVEQVTWLCNAMTNVVLAVDDIRGNLAVARTEIQDLETQMTADRNHFDQQLNLAGVDVTNTFNRVVGIEALINTVITNQNLPPPGGNQGAGGQGGGQAGGQGGGQQQPPPPLQPLANTPQVKMAKPDKFDGSKREELKKFMTSCRLFMDTNMSNHNEDQKVAFIISYLSGSARQWVQSYLEIDMLGNQVVLWLHDTTLFWREINARYGQLNEGEDYRHDLKKLRQKGTVQDYLTEFQRLSAYLGYNNITLRDLFYDNLSMDVKQSMLAQSFDPAGTTTFNQVAERALLIDKHIQQFAKVEKPKHTSSSSTSTNTARVTTTTTTQATTTKQLLAKGDRVFTIGTDGRATRGKVTKIAKNAKGFNAPWVKWDGQDSEVKMTFDSLKKDTRPAPSTPSDPKGPGPMDVDSAGKGKSVLICNRCQGKGHMAKDCPSRPMSGYEASVEKVESEEEESEKEDA